MHQDELIRAGFSSLLDEREHMRRTELCATWSDLYSMLERHRFDIAIIGHQLIGKDDERLVELKASVARIILLFEHPDDTELLNTTQVRPDGYLVVQGLTKALLLTTIQQVMNGHIPMPRQMIDGMFSEFQDLNRISRIGLRQLTPRELETLRLLVEGNSNKQIASSLGISINGAKRHVANILMKLNCSNRTRAAAEAVRLRVFSAT